MKKKTIRIKKEIRILTHQRECCAYDWGRGRVSFKIYNEKPAFEMLFQDEKRQATMPLFYLQTKLEYQCLFYIKKKNCVFLVN